MVKSDERSGCDFQKDRRGVAQGESVGRGGRRNLTEVIFRKSRALVQGEWGRGKADGTSGWTFTNGG